MSKILISAARASLQSGKAGRQQQVRRISGAFSRLASSSSNNRASNNRSSAGILLGVASSLVLPGTVALCEDDKGFLDKIAKKDKDGNTDWAKSLTQVTEADFWDKVATASGDKIQNAYDTGIPSQLSYGFVCGYCSGYALKAVGKGAAVVFGMGFMSLQTLSYYGYIKVDHTKFKQDFERAMDLNKDGKVDQEDAKVAYAKIMEVLQYSLPAGSGFGGGFLAGVRSG